MSEPGNINSLYTSFRTKYTHYIPDGQGRDKYIIQNNGGLCSEAQRPVFSSNMFHRGPANKMAMASQKQATSFKYVSDGSGRDFYITFNSGGLESAYIPGQKHPSASFFQSLRSNLKITNFKRHISPKEREYLKRWRSSQRNLVERLTANSSKWKEMTKGFRRWVSRRSNSSIPSRKTSTSILNESRNKIINKTISNSQLENYNTSLKTGVNEYEDKPRKIKHVQSFSNDKLDNIKISKYLEKRQNQNSGMKKRMRMHISNSVEGRLKPNMDNSLQVRRTKGISQSKLKSLLSNNPNKKNQFEI